MDSEPARKSPGDRLRILLSDKGLGYQRHPLRGLDVTEAVGKRTPAEWHPSGRHARLTSSDNCDNPLDKPANSYMLIDMWLIGVGASTCFHEPANMPCVRWSSWPSTLKIGPCREDESLTRLASRPSTYPTFSAVLPAPACLQRHLVSGEDSHWRDPRETCCLMTSSSLTSHSLVRFAPVRSAMKFAAMMIPVRVTTSGSTSKRFTNSFCKIRRFLTSASHMLAMSTHVRGSDDEPA